MHVLTENEIRNLAGRIESGGSFTVPAQTILTPLARDYLRARGINIVDAHSVREATRTEKPSVAQASGDEALVNAVADEVTRLLREKSGDGGGATGESADPAAMLARRADSGAQPGNRAVVWGIGGDRPGILAAVAELLGRRNANILEINQTILSGVFAMVVIIDLRNVTSPFAELKGELEGLGKNLGINLSAQRDEIFQYMHRV
jgi:ACT domain-containing protein